MWSLKPPLATVLLTGLTQAKRSNTTYTNPIIPGWHSDPSCVFVPELDNTTFCTTSSFMMFPGNPIYASRDLIHWELASNALSRVAQLPTIRTATNVLDTPGAPQLGGMFANTLRYHSGKFYLISTWANADAGLPSFVLNTATDPYNDDSWTDLLYVETPVAQKGFTIDPDIFFDDDGKVIVAGSGSPIIACYLDLATGKTSEPWPLWNGTGGSSPEGPHIYKRDGYYYLLIAEGGTQIGHAATVARSKSLNGTWESSPHNPLVSNKNTAQYFQTVGHADLFQDADKNWWGVALTTRGGPVLYNESIFPMGRETALYPVSWPKNGWPVADQVRGQMSGPLPSTQPAKSLPGIGPVVGKAEKVDFKSGSSIPNDWLFYRAPFDDRSFQISPKGHPNTLQIVSSRANLTSDASFNASLEGVNAVFRRQEHTFFNYTVHLQPCFGQNVGDELGVSNFLNQFQHVDVGIVYLQVNGALQAHFRFRANSIRAPMPREIITPVPKAWLQDTIRVRISPDSESQYSFYVASAGRLEDERLLASYSTALLSGDGAGTGGLFGVYATTNGGGKSFNGYISKWRYTPVAQKVDYNVVLPA